MQIEIMGVGGRKSPMLEFNFSLGIFSNHLKTCIIQKKCIN